MTVGIISYSTMHPGSSETSAQRFLWAARSVSCGVLPTEPDLKQAAACRPILGPTLRTAVLARAIIRLHGINQPFVTIRVGQRLIGCGHVGIAKVGCHAKWLVACTRMSIGSEQC